MRRLLILLAILFAAFWGCRLLIPKAEAQEKRTKRQLVIRGTPFPENIFILVDASGSMTGPPYEKAVKEAMKIATQATDGMRLRFAVFGSTLVWDSQGWIKCPDLEAVTLGHAFLLHASFMNPGDSTNLVEAMQEILKLEDDPLGIVILTDAQPVYGANDAATMILSENAKRKNAAVIGVIAIDPQEEDEALGKVLAESGGSYIRIVTVK